MTDANSTNAEIMRRVRDETREWFEARERWGTAEDLAVVEPLVKAALTLGEVTGLSSEALLPTDEEVYWLYGDEQINKRPSQPFESQEMVRAAIDILNCNLDNPSTGPHLMSPEDYRPRAALRAARFMVFAASTITETCGAEDATVFIERAILGAAQEENPK